MVGTITLTETRVTAATTCVVSTSTSGGEATLRINYPSNTDTVNGCDWLVPAGVTNVKVALVGGGGSAGLGWAGGGGGGGQVQYNDSLAVTPGQSFNVMIGQGGAKKTTTNRTGNSGTQTKFGSVTALGGGGGGGSNSFWYTAGNIAAGMNPVGLSGGSGGGNNLFGNGASNTTRSTALTNTFAGWTAFGNPGGWGVSNGSAGVNATWGAGSGGGGAYEAGTDSVNNNGAVSLGRGGRGILLLGVCLGGGGESNYQNTPPAGFTYGSSITTQQPCVSPDGTTTGGTSGAIYRVPATANSGGGGSGYSMVGFEDHYPGADGTVVIRYTVPVPTISSSANTNVQRPIISGTGIDGHTITLSAGGATYTTTVAAGAWAINLNTATPASGSLALTTNGINSITATSTDLNGGVSSATTQSLTIDTTAPATPTFPSALSVTNINNRNIAFTAETGTTSECSIAGGSYSLCSSPYSTGILADGSQTLRVKSTDAAGNVSSIGVYTWTIDTVAPTAPTISNTAVYQTSTSVTVNFSAVAGTTVTCKLDTGTAGSCTSATTMAYTGLAQGSHSVTIFSADTAGNVSSSSYNFTVDSIAPAVPVIANSAAYATTNSLSIAFTGEAGGVNSCSLDNAAFATCSSPFATGTLSEGAHNLRVKTTDSAGNVSSIATYNWTQDTIAPNAPVINNTAAYTQTSTITISFAASPGTTTCKLDNGNATSCTTATTMLYTGLAEGSHTVRIVTTDPAGNFSATTYNWTQDTIAPTVPVIGSAAAYSNTSSRSLAFTSESGSTSQCSLDSGVFAICSSPFATGTLSDGSHNLRVRSIDLSGNTSAIATYSWTQDTVAPALPQISNSATYVTNSYVTVTFTSDAGTVTCQLDSSPATSCTSATTATYSSLTEGNHTITVYTQDAAGNISSANYSFAVDTVAPTLPVIDSSPALTNNASSSFTFTFEAGSAAKCSLDTAAFTACSSPVSYSSLSDGQHTLRVRSVDLAGNISQIASRTWNIDTIAPATPTISTHAAYQTNSTVTINFNSEAGNSVTCQLDSAAATNCSGDTSKSFDNLTEGPHNFTVTATDAAGNSSTSSYTFTVDTIAPNAPLKALDNSAPRSRTSLTTAIFNFTLPANTTGQCRLETAQSNAFDWTTCTSGYQLTGLALDTYRFSVRSVDPAGNASSIIQYDWEVAPPGPGLPTLTFANNVVTLTGAAGGVNGDRYEYKLVDANDNIVIAWGAAQSSFALRVSNGDYQIFARLVDDQNAIGNAVSQTITITDQPAPAAASTPRLNIATTNGYSTTSNLDVSIDWPLGTKSVRLFSTQNNNGGAGLVTSLSNDWLSSGDRKTKSWNFTPAGIPTVTATHNLTAEFLDAAGVVINSQLASVIIDVQAPTFSSAIPTAIENNTLPIQINATDEAGGSGLGEVLIARTGGGIAIASTPALEPYTIINGYVTVPNVTLGETLTVQIRDRAGNISAASFRVAALNRQTLNPIAKFNGTAKVGQTLKLTPGTWPKTHKVTYQWLADGTPIASATKTTFKLTTAQAGKRISVAVTGSRPTYYPITVTTPTGAMVTGGTFTAGTVRVTGTAQVGQTLTATVGTWTNNPTLTYVWKRGTTVVGNSLNYTLTAQDSGKKLTFTATGTKPGFTTLAKTITTAVIRP